MLTQVERLTDATRYRVYYPSAVRRAAMRVGALIFGLMGGLLVAQVIASVVGGGLQLELLLLMAFGIHLLIHATNLWLSADRMRIVISCEGIEYHTVGCSIIARWENVQGIARMRKGRATVECLKLGRVDAVESSLLHLLGLNADAGYSIPLGYFGGWRCSEVGEAVRAHLPHLFPPSKRGAGSALNGRSGTAEPEAWIERFMRDLFLFTRSSARK